MLDTISPVFMDIDPHDLTAVLKTLERRRFTPGSVIVAEGDAPRTLFIIETGYVDVVVADPHGGEHHLSRLGPGATIGEMSLFTGEPTSATVRAAADVTAMVLPETQFHRIAEAHPRIYRNIGSIMAERLARSNRRAVRSGASNVTLLANHGAPNLLAYGLACSLAWHTQASVLLLAVNETEIAELQPFAQLSGSLSRAEVRTLQSREKGALFARATPSADFAPDTLGWSLDDLSDAFGHVLVLADATVPIPVRVARTVHLSPAGFGAVGRAGRRDLVIRGWSTAAAFRPDLTGILEVQSPVNADEQGMARGLLRTSTAMGHSLGWAARDIAGLQVGLALGAGSAKGYAHVGVLQVLQRAGVPVDFIAGTSIGSCVAGGYALRYAPEEMAALLDKVAATVWRPTVPTTSILSSTGLRTGLQRIFGQRHFEDLPVPFGVVAADVQTQQEVVFRRGLVWPALLASAAIPGIFPPQCIGGHTLVDGGVLNPVPTDVVAGLGADKVIAVKLASRTRDVVRLDAECLESVAGGSSVFQNIMRAIDIMQTQISAHTAGTASVLIEVPFSGVEQPGIRNFTEGRRFMQLGDDAATAALPRLASILPWLRSNA